ncbi:MAG: tetratricopeptide repeat protein [Leptothrix sp. (in: b-proteobacteria)]
MSLSDPSAALHAAQLQLGAGAWAEAEQTLRRLLKRQPGIADAHRLLSVLAESQARPADALRHAQVAVAQAPGRADIHVAHGRALKASGRLDDAAGAYLRALRLRSDYAEAHVSLGIVRRLQGRLDDAIEQQRQALRLRADFPEALNNLGNALAERIAQAVDGQFTAEDLREAEQLQRRALALAPGNANAMRSLALVLKLTGRYQEAVELFNRALGAEPARIDTCIQFAELLQLNTHHDLARNLLLRWLGEHGGPLAGGSGSGVGIEPTVLSVAMSLLVESLVQLGEADIAVLWLNRIDAISPGSPTARHHRGRVMQQRWEGDVDVYQSMAMFRQAIDARPDYLEAVCSYLMTRSYVECDPAVNLAEHRLRIAPVLAAVPTAAPAATASIPAAPRRADARIRIGYVSHDFKRHSVAYFMEAVLASHDRSRFELVGYKTHAADDEVTLRLRDLFDVWVESNHLSDAQLADRVRADRIDVLIDLNGLTSGTRIGLFQRRPAPCQLTYLGYPTTTGADCFDGRLSDVVIDPAGPVDSQAHNSEPLLRLPQSMFCYRPGPAPTVSPLPALRAGAVTFGSFNNLYKANERTLSLWRDVLRAVPGSRLLLKAQSLGTHSNREHLLQRFATLGIEPQRLTFLPWNPDVQAHLEAYNHVDIGLDTTPFNGATTTCESLWMGVPVLTLAGRTHPSRMGASILGAAGLADWVTHSEADYVARAVAAVSDLSRLAALRADLREQLSASRLLDGAGFTRDYEALLRKTWLSA